MTNSIKINILDKEKVDFPTTSEYPKEAIRKVQAELLSMCETVCGKLEDHNVPYFIAFGTLFGALKFNGFLPWDDDIDIFLFDETYDRAISILEKQLKGNLIVHNEKNDPKYFLNWSKVKNLDIEVKDNGIYNPDNRLLKHKCLGLDLYRLKKVSLKELNNYKKEEAIKFFTKKLKAGIIDNETYNKKIRELNFQNTRKQRLEHPDMEVYTFVVKMRSPILPSDIFPLKKYKFENLFLWGPHNPIGVLSASFDNIDKLPDYEERKPHLSKVIIKNQV